MNRWIHSPVFDGTPIVGPAASEGSWRTVVHRPALAGAFVGS